MDAVVMKLSGNLGERHRCFNALVQEAYQQNTSLPVEDYSKEAALDRLFKIDLASKQRNVDFIIHTLKDDDMLYVNRALKSLWLLEPQYSNIINPNFLEDQLFPDMILPAVNKTRHWIQMHLRDPQRCEEFHQFYKERDPDVAIKFLCHCSNEYVLRKINDALERITPKLLKRLSEKVPQITKIYYDSLKQNQDLLKYYQANDTKFFSNIKYLLKTDSNIFFYVLENFFNLQKFRRLSAGITNYIMKQHKSRFLWKPELYTVSFLDLATLARHLSSEEIKDLVLKLARAEYLEHWFSYKSVEPLIKRINKEERTEFKILVFVDKAFGATVKDWPYPVPNPPVYKVHQIDLFDDIEMGANCIEHDDYVFRSYKPKTLLDDLFDKYRFYTFEQTFLELQKQIKAESSPENRMFMLLVLVSKTGGRIEYVVSLLDLLWQHRNEPVQIRAAIVRSLVKRASVWRLPPEHWAKLLQWAHDLGLDGRPSVANCYEGLHAVVIRDLIAGVDPNEEVLKMFLNDFNTLRDYSFTTDELRRVRVRLPELLLASFRSNSFNFKLHLLENLLDTLDAYDVKFEDFPGTVEAVVVTYRNPQTNAQSVFNSDVVHKIDLFRRLYDAGVARKHLMREYFEIIQTDASYVNALRHDVSIVGNIEKLEALIYKRELKHEKFFRKLALYFMEKDGLGEQYYGVLAERAAALDDAPFTRRRRGFPSFNQTERQILAKPLAALSGSKFTSLLETLDKGHAKSARRQIAAALRSNAHIVRPTFNLDSFGWRQAGAKAVANRVTVCRQRDVERYLEECLTWRNTLRLALVLAKRVNKERDVFQVFVSKRPAAALKAALRYFCREQESADIRIWELVKPHIYRARRQRKSVIEYVKVMPAIIKTEFCFLVYEIYKRYKPTSQWQAFLLIPSVLPQLDEQYVFDIIEDFLSKYFKDHSIMKDKLAPDHDEIRLQMQKVYANERLIKLYIEIIAKFLVLSTSEDTLEERYRKVALPFLSRLQLFWKQVSGRDKTVEKFLDTFLYYLRYNKAYLDVTYVSCLRLFEKITEWMHGFLPVERWFAKHVKLNLTKIYFKSIRHCLDQNPASFSESRKSECSYMLGTVFGNLVANESEGLMQKYFPSITELYGTELVNYFIQYIYREKDDCFERFTVAVMNALVTNSASCVLAKYIFEEFKGNLKAEYVVDVLKQFDESGIKVLRVETFEPLPFTDLCYFIQQPDRYIQPVRGRKRNVRRRGRKRRKHDDKYY